MKSELICILTPFFAGELIFALPFHIARFFRPTLLHVFEFSNTQLGDIFAAYGVTAMLSYFPGGTIADRYSARGLMTLSLFATGLGGIYMATFPGELEMALLYAYWGVTTIFLFWGALIKSTREWGGILSQGKAFGILDGGRGLIAAGFAIIAVAVFSSHLPDATLIVNNNRQTGFRFVILLYSAATLGAGVITWLVLPKSSDLQKNIVSNPFSSMAIVARRPIVWAQAGIIICAYCGYKGLDNYSLYAVQVLGMDEVQGARFAAYAAYFRPIAALIAGITADRFSASRSVLSLFILLSVSYGVLAIALPNAFWSNIIYGNIFVTFFSVFALRGIYFALLQETQTPKAITGTTVGMVSFVGFTPEIFFASIAGRILDHSPGVLGHQNYFKFLGSIMVLGMLVTSALIYIKKREQAI